MTTYFENCQSIEEAKTEYKRLARELHPDMGGTTEAMQELNRQWADYQANFAKTNARKRQQDAHAEGKKSAADYHDMDALAEELRIKIEFGLNLSGVDVELMGLWVWLTGNTKEHKESIKAQGFKWAKEKEAWYFAGVPTFNRQRRSLDEIRNMHGSQKFNRPQRADSELLHA